MRKVDEENIEEDSQGELVIGGEERQLSGHLQSPTVIDDGRLVSECENF